MPMLGCHVENMNCTTEFERYNQFSQTDTQPGNAGVLTWCPFPCPWPRGPVFWHGRHTPHNQGISQVRGRTVTPLRGKPPRLFEKRSWNWTGANFCWGKFACLLFSRAKKNVKKQTDYIREEKKGFCPRGLEGSWPRKGRFQEC